MRTLLGYCLWALFTLSLCEPSGTSDSVIYSDELQFNTSKVLNKDCGVTAYNATERPLIAREHENPWLALLYYHDEPLHFCHATLITDRFLLSTASCATSVTLNQTKAMIGAYDNNIQSGCTDCLQPPFARLIDNMFLPEDYVLYENDVALLRLDNPVYFSKAVRPICLPLYDIDLEMENGLSLYHSLWTNDTRPEQHWMKYLSADDCQTALNKRFKIKDGQLCARLATKQPLDALGGAGSALQFELHRGIFQLAVLSIGQVNAAGGTPYIFVRLPKFVSWIERTITENQS